MCRYVCIFNVYIKNLDLICFIQLANLTVSIRPGTSYQIEIHSAVVNHLYLLFPFAKLVET